MQKKLYSFPTKNEFRWGGISMLISHGLYLMTGVLCGQFYDAYNVDNESDVIKLHDILSSQNYRIRAEIACALLWVSFPFLLIELYVWQKLMKCVTENYGEIFAFLFEKAYLMVIFLIVVVMPAIVLVLVSYDWTFHESGITGYYIQLSFTIFWLELYDSTMVAEAVFMLSIFFNVRYMIIKSYDDVVEYSKVFKVIQANNKCCSSQKCRKAMECGSISCGIFLAIIFLIVLFEFGKSGIFAFDSYLKWILIWSVIIRIIIGIRFIWISKENNYFIFHEIFSDKTRMFMDDYNDDDNDNEIEN